MVTQSRELLHYRESGDSQAAQAGIEVSMRRKWRAAEAVDIANQGYSKYCWWAQ